MIQFAVAIKGYWRVPPVGGEPFVQQQFQLQTDNANDAYARLQAELGSVFKDHYLSVPKDPKKSIQGLVGLNNILAIHIDLFTHIEVDVRVIPEQTPIPVAGAEGTVIH